LATLSTATGNEVFGSVLILTALLTPQQTNKTNKTKQNKTKQNKTKQNKTNR
jgi:hypothetical protein